MSITSRLDTGRPVQAIGADALRVLRGELAFAAERAERTPGGVSVKELAALLRVVHELGAAHTPPASEAVVDYSRLS